jgi:hypothetical protein
MHAIVEISDSKGRIKRRRLTPQRNVVISDPSSRQAFCKIDIRGSACLLTDAGCPFPIQVNGELIDGHCILRNGAHVQFGPYQLSVSIADSTPVPPSKTKSRAIPAITADPRLRSCSRDQIETACMVCSRKAVLTAEWHESSICWIPTSLRERSRSKANRMPEASPGLPLCKACWDKHSTYPVAGPYYWIVEKRGAGGTGIVYKARKTLASGWAAIKMNKLPRDLTHPDARRFLRGSHIQRLMTELKSPSPHILQYDFIDKIGQMLFVATEWVDGHNFAEYLKLHGCLPEQKAVGWICQVLSGLLALHSEGIVHRDIKPDNLMITTFHDKELIKVVDFGLARLFTQSAFSGITHNPEAIGSPYYMAPEHFDEMRTVGPAADQYSVAATLYTLLTGRYPHDFPPENPRLTALEQKLLWESQAAVISEWRSPRKIREDLPGISEGLASIIEKAMARNPEARFKGKLGNKDRGEGVQELREALRKFGHPQ